MSTAGRGGKSVGQQQGQYGGEPKGRQAGRQKWKEKSTVEHKRFGSYLRKVREERRLSLDAVEEMSLGMPERVTKSHLSRIETGQAVPTFPRMFTLSRIYGIPVSHMAERFEIALRQGMLSDDSTSLPVQEVRDRARRLRVAGRHIEALLLYEALLARPDAYPAGRAAEGRIDLELQCINCLLKLARETTAKEECEKLLGSPSISQRQRVLALQYLAMCCYKLSKFTVATMAIERAEAELAKLPDSDELAAHLAVMKGNLQFALHNHEPAAEAYRSAQKTFQSLGVPFEACRAQINLASALIELGSHANARIHLKEALKKAEQAGYDRQRAFAISHLALIAYRENDLDAAEAHCLRSNRLARPRDFVPILFRNCYYLWRIALTRGDEAGVKTNERTLRTYLNRVEDYMPEAEAYRAHLGGGTNHD